jgi:hypothetical protein
MPEYSRLDKLLHTFALNYQFLKTTSFDIERSLARADAALVAQEPHLFITGLARAGTSILLRILYSSGCFATQSYRDMPFVLAPQLWRRISGRHRLTAGSAERAHKDGLEIGFDSVEAFEEVFWLTHAKDLYVRDDHLAAHAVDEDLCAEFRDYVAVVIAAQRDPAAKRYLSKNNNNVLRLPGLARALPAIHIVVPFREPYQHARSLLRQHQLFSESQTTDRFMRRYMGWLGHYEFGLDYRPFMFDGEPPRVCARDASTIDHWLESWTRVYRGVLATAPNNVVFWDYDAFCADPQDTLAKLAARIDLEGQIDRNAAAEIRPPRPYETGKMPDGSILRSAQETYDKLRARARATLSR